MWNRIVEGRRRVAEIPISISIHYVLALGAEYVVMIVFQTWFMNASSVLTEMTFARMKLAGLRSKCVAHQIKRKTNS